MYKYFKRVVNSDYILEWKPKKLTDESIKSPSAPNNFLNPNLSYYGNKMEVIYSGSCLNQDKSWKYLNSCNHGKVVNIYTFYEISKNINITSYPTIEKFLFGAVSYTKNVDIDKYKYSGYGIGFDRHGFFHILVVELVEM